MDPRFFPHNTHHEEPLFFRDRDPQLRQLKRLPKSYRPPLLDALPKDAPGIFTLGGGRQVGKTTLLKLWMAELLERGISPESLVFLSGEMIDDHHSLLRHLQEVLAEMPDKGTRRIILDEVTYIRNWDRAVKFVADAGMLERTSLMITGSDLALMLEAKATFPGRRGAEDVVDFHLRPLSFRESYTLEVGDEAVAEITASDRRPTPEELEPVFGAFERYLIHGGYLTAINDMAAEGRIRRATLAIYADWIRGDFAKRGRKEESLREILGAVIRRMGSQITWNSLARDLSIEHPKTVADYVDLLVSMDAVFVQPALIENRLAGAPKKARKVMYSDPFIFHAVRSWLRPVDDPFSEQIVSAVRAPEICARLVEACVATHCARHFPTFYIKAAGEVDVAYVAEGRFWPVEVKWSEQARPAELKQIQKYENGRILTRSRSVGAVQGLPTIPLPLALLRWPECMGKAGRNPG
ncbi:MAG: ATP-binding protein [Thermoanaerobaculales bacterium]|nr:ATP-binding protein [Thermoanaerobaculales bacterium]